MIDHDSDKRPTAAQLRRISLNYDCPVDRVIDVLTSITGGVPEIFSQIR